MVFPDRIGVVHGASRYTWKRTAARSRRLSSVLSSSGIGKGDTVAALLPNVAAMRSVTCTAAVPMSCSPGART